MDFVLNISSSAIGLIDPGFDNTLNLGDQIISDSVRKIIQDVCSPVRICRVSSHTRIAPDDVTMLRGCRLVIVGGTNLLKSEMRNWRQWKIYLRDTIKMDRVLLMGVGWWQYQRPPEFYSRTLIRRLLHKKLIHSVRDSYTAVQLSRIGVHNTINTSCPTLWSLTDERVSLIPPRKSKYVIVTLTSYNKDPERDKAFLSCVANNYEKVYFWPQSDEDVSYAAALSENIAFLSNNLAAYDDFLRENRDVDYVGTRLHGGIRAMQHGKRSIIIAIDNRATEIGRDIGLPIVAREDIAELEKRVTMPFVTSLSLPISEIERWCEQLRKLTEPRTSQIHG